MNLLEKELEDMIFDAAKTPEGQNFLIKRGLPIAGKVFRQVNLGAYGIADLMAITIVTTREDPSKRHPKGRIIRSVNIEIIELKRNLITLDALSQAARYQAAIRDILFHTQSHLDLNFSVKITLIGAGLEMSSEFLFLLNLLPEVGLYAYDFTIKGIQFKPLRNRGDHWYKKDDTPSRVEVSKSAIRDMIRLSRGLQDYMDFKASMSK